ncbi:zinc finger and BTB domain-containing protein 1 [Clupea harengus]|uniref:Zinc finger and BTB domain-containing protein 1 n=1 Tax=Clupea harengus TaxID=7950 RepID=A0A6P8GJ76_CLUHA|nr:zinc finger and BTB domain-containing protein 1 [Clupea harengus]XP_031437475.1 zinc finger and BTB domain-containing protein 1 [Clupea harengus]
MARPSHSEHVLQQLNNQREWGFLCDCCITIGDTYFRAHKAVLAACSSYFRMLFIRDQQATARLDLSNMQISAECFDLILQLMYLGRIMVGHYEFEELKASMAYLQMYYIPDSLEDLRDIRTSNLTPSSCASSSSSSSSSSSASVAAGKMIFGVRMFDQNNKPSATEPELPSKVPAVTTRQSLNVSTVRPVEDVVPPLPPLPSDSSVNEQPCDLRKRGSGRSSTLKERPRFGRTYTCDDCGFVFSCEKLLIEHILTCTNRKAFQPPRVNSEVDNDSSKAESSASEGPEEHRVMCKGEDDWPDQKSDSETVIRSVGTGTDNEAIPSQNVTIKVEQDDDSEPEMASIRVIKVGNHSIKSCSVRLGSYKDIARDTKRFDKEAAGVSAMEEDTEGSLVSGDETGASSSKVLRIKEEKQDEESSPCELCGALLTEEEQSAHYISNHMGHICACGRCGQVLIKGRQLQEHAERCGEPQSVDLDSPEEDSPPPEDAQAMDEGLLEGYRCPLCGLVFESENLAVEHTLVCPEQEPFRPTLLDEGGELDHRRKHFCAICGKGFYQRCHLREHYTVHTKEKQFTCQTCGKQFLRERQLRLHTDMHKGMARYVCPVCDQGTFLKHDHVRHMISHLSAGETICQVCFQIFPSGDQLEKHMDVHLYICGVCGEKFRLRKDMRSHYNSKHTKRQ